MDQIINDLVDLDHDPVERYALLRAAAAAIRAAALQRGQDPADFRQVDRAVRRTTRDWRVSNRQVRALA